jgi:hypothetical protein
MIKEKEVSCRYWEISLPNGEYFIAQDNIYGTEWMVFHRDPDNHIKTIKNCLGEMAAKELAIKLALNRADEIGVTPVITSSTSEVKIEYDVIAEDNLGSLIESVNKATADRWKLQGGIFILHRQWENERKGYTQSETIYYQAVFR